MMQQPRLVLDDEHERKQNAGRLRFIADHADHANVSAYTAPYLTGERRVVYCGECNETAVGATLAWEEAQ